MHAQIVLSHPSQDYSPLFLEIADAFFEKELFKDANEIYEALGADAAVGILTSHHDYSCDVSMSLLI